MQENKGSSMIAKLGVQTIPEGNVAEEMQGTGGIEKKSLVQMQVELAKNQKINPEMKTQSQMEEDMQTVEAVASQSKEKLLPETKTPSS